MPAIPPESLNYLIANRRSVFPKDFIEKPIPKELIIQILENGNWAPSHKKTEPWRFKVFLGDSRKQLGEYLAAWYKQNTPSEKFLEKKYQKSIDKANQSSCIIAICMQRDPEERVPEWEEIAAVSCAVQNMWLSCAAYGIGSYWSSPKAINEIGPFLGLSNSQKCLGLMYLGYAKEVLSNGSRKNLQDKIEFI